METNPRTKSILIQNLCVPCCNHCRHCLLTWDGNVVGTAWERGVRLAERYCRELREQLPDVNVGYTFGYSMEHPHLEEAIRVARKLGGPTAEFLQCDGMRMRNESQCQDLMKMLKKEGIKTLNFTIYGPSEYHDAFAGRKGDYELLLRMMDAARDNEVPFTVGIPVTKENVGDLDSLVEEMAKAGNERTFLFVPHEEGRGMLLDDIRLCGEDLRSLDPAHARLLNGDVFRTESDWLKEKHPVKEENRLILISLRSDNIADYESRGALSVVREIEHLDEAYYAAFPSFEELTETYGDFSGDRLFRIRDLYYHYRKLYTQDHGLSLYDVTDERQSGSRRY